MLNFPSESGQGGRFMQLTTKLFLEHETPPFGWMLLCGCAFLSMKVCRSESADVVIKVGF